MERLRHPIREIKKFFARRTANKNTTPIDKINTSLDSPIVLAVAKPGSLPQVDSSPQVEIKTTTATRRILRIDRLEKQENSRDDWFDDDTVCRKPYFDNCECYRCSPVGSAK